MDHTFPLASTMTLLVPFRTTVPEGEAGRLVGAGVGLGVGACGQLDQRGERRGRKEEGGRRKEEAGRRKEEDINLPRK